MLPAFRQLVDALRMLPGIGERTATRMAVDILQLPDARIRRMVQAMEGARERIRFCSNCHGYAEQPLCAICDSDRIHHHQLCVVQSPIEIWQIESTGRFAGSYHVLGGVLSPIDNVGPEDLHLASLIQRLQEPRYTEILFALPATPEAEATAQLIQRSVPDGTRSWSHLAYGIPVGGSLEYLDERTLGFAIDHRRPL